MNRLYFFSVAIFYISLLQPFGIHICPKSKVGIECYIFFSKQLFAPGLLSELILPSLI